jgi:excisionase family DNA binding protein
VKHIYEKVRLGKIPAKQVGKRWRITQEALEKFKAGRETART